MPSCAWRLAAIRTIALTALVARLRSESPDFAARWSEARVTEHRISRKTAHTPVGEITIDCDVLTVPEGDLKLVVYTAFPGSEESERLDLLRVVGTQAMT